MKLLRRANEPKPAPVVDLTGQCAKHGFEAATGRCSSCNEVFCDECLVFPFGPRRPLCVSCALVAAGLRRSSRLVRC